jgi:hypothetical protein
VQAPALPGSRALVHLAACHDVKQGTVRWMNAARKFYISGVLLNTDCCMLERWQLSGLPEASG